MPDIAAVIPAAGRGTRMRSERAKVLHPIAGRPMWEWVADACAAVGAAPVITVVSRDFVPPALSGSLRSWVRQEVAAGTGDAVRCAVDTLPHLHGTVLIVYGDTPLITVEILQQLIDARRGADLVLTAFESAAPGAYGRVITDETGDVRKIVEARDCSPVEAQVTLCNAGPMAIDAALLRSLLPHLTPRNAAGEYYLTDVVDLAVRAGRRCTAIRVPFETVGGINDRADLAAAERIMQNRLRAAAMAGGVTMIDPDTVYLRHDTRLAADVTLWPNVVFGPGTEVESGAEILPFCHLEGVKIGAGVRVGPYARLRPGTVIEAGAYVGNFTEVKNSRVRKGAKIGHFSYTGDAVIGENANIGAGTVTCNYDGVKKHGTDIGAGAFIGSGSMLVAPVRIGAGAVIGAGTVLKGTVPDGALALSRAPLTVKIGGAAKYKE